MREVDLHQYGHDLQLLRQHQVRPRSEEPSVARPEGPPSFKAAFAERCRTESDPRDAWGLLRNPELLREKRDNDLTLNQVWIEAAPKRILNPKEPALAAADAAAPSQSAPLDAAKAGVAGRHGESSVGRQGSVSIATPRIRLLASLDVDDLDEHLAGFRQPGEQLQTPSDAAPRIAWLSLSPKSGRPRLYHRAVAERLETAFSRGRCSVPLVGLGRDVDSCIVMFEPEEECGRMIERTPKGRCREVRRIEAQSDEREATLYVTLDEGRWKFVPEQFALRHRAADAMDVWESQVEVRKVVLSSNGLVLPPGKLPPVGRPRRTSAWDSSCGTPRTG